MSAKMQKSDQELFSIQWGLVKMSAPQNSALAGVGKPINESVWRWSILNFASRKAEKAAMRNAK